MSNTITLRIETAVYNHRRYGRPWIAQVDFKTNPRGDYQWGAWIGDEGDAGLLTLDAKAGDVVATGQKDFRKPGSLSTEFFIVGEDGSLRKVSRVDAFNHQTQTA